MLLRRRLIMMRITMVLLLVKVMMGLVVSVLMGPIPVLVLIVELQVMMNSCQKL
jgi:hypothetical protein